MTPSGSPRDEADSHVQRRWIVEFASLPVIALVGLVLLMFGAGILGMTSGTFRCDMKRKVRDDIRSIDSALEAYASAHGGKYPEILSALVTPDADGRKFFDANHIPKDLWGHDYIYDPPAADHPRARVICYGRDGVPGGAGDDADVDNLSLRAER
jgi:type II secretory pathway pseudopilin PulG